MESEDLLVSGFRRDRHVSQFAGSVLNYSDVKPYADVEIVGYGASESGSDRHRMFSVHSQILASCSAVLGEVLRDSLDRSLSPLVVIENCDHHTMKNLITFLYHGAIHGSEPLCVELVDILRLLGSSSHNYNIGAFDADNEHPGCGALSTHTDDFESVHSREVNATDVKTDPKDLAMKGEPDDAGQIDHNDEASTWLDEQDHDEEAETEYVSLVPKSTEAKLSESVHEELTDNCVASKDQKILSANGELRTLRERRKRKRRTERLNNGEHSTAFEKGGGKHLTRRRAGLTRLKVDSSDKPYQCNICSRKFRKCSNMRIHMRLHTGEKPHRCPHADCGRSFADRNGLKYHLVSIHSSLKPYVCSFCGANFKVSSVLKRHIAVVHERATKLIPCEICKRCFASHERLKDHMNVHTGDKPYVCSSASCGASFCLRSSYNEHMKRHKKGHTFTVKRKLSELKKDTSKRPFECEVCKKRFRMISGLDVHMRQHTGEKPYCCSTCGKRFADPSAHANHEKIHTGEKAFVCTICAKSFINKTQLKQHEYTHSNDKPFKCEKCSKQFISKIRYTTHVQAHDGNFVHKCAHCGKGFVERQYLLNHERTHTGEKPFNCVYCDARFVQKWNCVVHERTHTGEKYQCEHCTAQFKERRNLMKHLRANHQRMV